MAAVEMDEGFASGRRTERSGSTRRTSSNRSCATTRRHSSKTSSPSCFKGRSPMPRRKRPWSAISKSSIKWAGSKLRHLRRRRDACAARLRPDVQHAARLFLPVRARRGRNAAAVRQLVSLEMVELDIEGDHLLPVVRNRKLMLCGPCSARSRLRRRFVCPPRATPCKARKAIGTSSWRSEYHGGQWTAKSVSKGTPLRAYQGRDDVLFGKATGGVLGNTGTTTRDHSRHLPLSRSGSRRLPATGR